MDAYIARQPILDRRKDVFGYELLFRSGADNFFRPVDGDRATASLIDDAVHLHSLENLTQGRMCFINFTKKSLVDGLYTMLPSVSTVVEVLETVELDDELLEACKKLRKLGYVLALDDYVVEPRFEPLLSMIDLLKVEFPVLTAEQHQLVVNSAKQYGFRLLAEKVETPEQFELAMRLGYDYFQGYFFCKPQMRRARRLPKSQAQCLRLLQKVNESEFKVDQIEELFRGDLALSYKLLRYANSPLYQRTNSLNSVRHAIITLGQRPLRQWVSLMAVEELSGEKPVELMTTCLTRARFCELAGAQVLGSLHSPDCFLVGMFSLLNAMLDQPMDQLAGDLNLADPLRFALLGQSSQLLPFLELAMSIENADWDAISGKAESLGLSVADVLSLHRDSIEWAVKQQNAAHQSD